MADHPERRGERGASAVEYAILVAGIAALIVVAVIAFGGPVKELFTDTCDQLDAQPSVSAGCTP